MSTLSLQSPACSAEPGIGLPGLAASVGRLAARRRLELLLRMATQANPGDAPVQNVSLEDLRDIRAGLGGDGEAFARLVRRYQDEIARYMWKFSRDPQMCEELVQDVFVEAYFSLRSFHGRSPFLHWLRRIATRTGYRFWKAKARSRTVVSATDACAAEQLSCLPAAQLQPGEAADLLHGLLERLAPRDRLVLTLMYLEGLPVAKIADLTGWSKTLVKVQAHRARTRLKRWIQTTEIRP